MIRKYQPITVGTLLGDPLLKKYMPKNFSRGILERQLADAQLMKLDLDELSGMDVEDLATLVFSHGLSLESQLGPQETAEAAADEDTVLPAGNGAVSIILGGMAAEAKIVMNEPEDGAAPLGETEIYKALRSCGVTYGIKTEFISRLVERPIYGRRFKIAEGRLPVDGTDGKVIFHFDEKSDLSPHIGQNGNADYKTLNYAKSVKKGEVLCEITLPTRGTDGVSVRGEVLPGKPGKPAEIGSGSNTVLSEDGLQIRAACDGQVRIKGEKITVSRVLEVDRVDGRTGNILFVGSVQVNGDVAGGFTIRAGGDIMVKGVVENATLISGGNIVLCSGITGRDGGVLDAAGSIRTLFIENAAVGAKKNIYADAIINSTVECGLTVNLSGENGCLRGGICTAGRDVRARDIGNEANIATAVCLKDTETPEARRAQAELRITRYMETIDRLRMVTAMAAEDDRTDMRYQIMLVRMVITKQRLEVSIRELRSRSGGNTETAQVRTAVARGTLYPNVSIEIDGELFRSSKIRTACALTRLDGRISVMSSRSFDGEG